MRTRSSMMVLLSVWLVGCSNADVNQWVNIEVPPSVATIEAGTLRVSLFRYDPNLMDAPATRVDGSVIAFSHRAGQRTSIRAHVRGNGSGGERFYLSVTGCASTAAGEVRVLWDGLAVELPTYVRMRPLEAPYVACALAEG